MRITLLLILMLLVTSAWVVLGVVREHAIVRNAQVHRALQFYTQEKSIQRIHQQHQRAIRQLIGREGPEQMERMEQMEQMDQTEPPKLPEWVKKYIDVQEDDGWFSYSVKSNLGGYLSSVPVLWFHGSFAVLNLVLIVLGLVSIYQPRTGT